MGKIYEVNFKMMINLLLGLVPDQTKLSKLEGAFFPLTQPLLLNACIELALSRVDNPSVILKYHFHFCFGYFSSLFIFFFLNIDIENS